jgi:hypothetical protein
VQAARGADTHSTEREFEQKGWDDEVACRHAPLVVWGMQLGAEGVTACDEEAGYSMWRSGERAKLAGRVALCFALHL